MTLPRAIVATLFVAVISLTACDNVNYKDAVQYQPKTANSVIDSLQDFVPQTPVRHTLLMDFTGQLCGNCPRGHEQAEAMKALYGDNFIVMAVHCSNFAVPFTLLHNPDSAYIADYRTSVGTDLDNRYGCGNAGLPQGVEDADSSTKGNVSSWANHVAAGLARSFRTALSMRMVGDTVVVRSTQQSASPQTLALSLYVLRDSIQGWQKDYNRNPQDIKGYWHRHMLRSRPVDRVSFIPQNFKGLKAVAYPVTFESHDKPWNNYVIATLSDSATGKIVQVSEIFALLIGFNAY